MVEILPVVHKNSSFPEVLFKRSVLKNVLEFTDKHKKQSSGGVLSKGKYVLAKVCKIHKKTSEVSFFNKGAGWKPSEAATGDVQ